MSSSPKYTEEFRIEAVRQVTERGFAVKEEGTRQRECHPYIT